MKKIIFLLLFALSVHLPVFTKGHEHPKYMHTPLCFVKNNGQVKDQDGKERNDIQYKLSASSGLNIFIGNGSLHYQFSKPNIFPCEKPYSHKKGVCEEIEPTQFDMYRLDVMLEDANPQALIITGEQQAYNEHYYCTKNHEINQVAKAFNLITYKNIYRNIDWVLYIKEGHLEYDFVVHPGGNVSDIKIRYDGATKLQKNNFGITAITPMGKISEGRLHSYVRNDGSEVACNFTRHDNYLGFRVANYSGTLVIDPMLEWGTYFGGDNARGQAVACTGPGSVYIGGYTTSPVNIATSGAYQTTYSGGDDAFLAKFDSSGAIIWATYYGGSGNDEVFGLAADSLGNVYLAGLTTSTNGIATSGAYQSNYGGGIGDAFLAKFSSAGALQWGTYYGGSGSDVCKGVCCDKAGNVYITGYTYSTDSIATAGAYKTSGGGDAVDGYIAKFNGAGTILWATYYGGSDDDEPTGIACDNSGDVYITGGTSSTDSISTPGAYQVNYESYDDDAFLVKFNSLGALQWGTYYGANGSNGVQGIACDGAGNVYITGSTSCTDSMATPGAHQTVLTGAANAFLAKFNAAGAIQWGTYYGSGGDGGNSLSLNNAGDVFMTGSTTSTIGIATPGAYQGIYAGGQDAFLTLFNSAGSLLWATYYGGAGSDDGRGVACDTQGNVYVTGTTTSTSGIVTHGAYDTVYGATSLNVNAFLAKFDTSSVSPGSTKQLLKQSASFNIYPNPANDLLCISWQGISGTLLHLNILSMTGQQLYSSELSSLSVSAVIPVTTFPDGSYICILQSGSCRYYNKFTIKR